VKFFQLLETLLERYMAKSLLLNLSANIQRLEEVKNIL